MPGRGVLVRQAGVVHAHQFEDEVGHAGEVEEDDAGVGGVVFAADDDGGEEEEEDGDGQGGDGQGHFVCFPSYHDEELDGEA